MKKLPLQKRTLWVLAGLVPLVGLFFYVAFTSGPLATVPTVLTRVENRSLTPGLFGIGTVEARYTYRIGPTAPGRLLNLHVHVGDHVTAGQILGEMDPVDLTERMRAQEVAVQRATAQSEEAVEQTRYAETLTLRYEKLLTARAVSEEMAAARQHEWRVAQTRETAAENELTRMRAEGDALEKLRKNLLLVAPSDGLVVSRNSDPGATVVAGQAVVELIDPASLWIHTRFDQIQANGLAADLPAEIVLRSASDRNIQGTVLRIEPLADVITEEILAKVVFDRIPAPLPPVGELAEVTVTLPARPKSPVIPNAAIRNLNGQPGVWKVVGDDLRLISVTLGASDLDGYVEVVEGLQPGDNIVLYSADPLTRRSRLRIVDRIPGVDR